MYKLGIKVGKNLSIMIFHRIVCERPKWTNQYFASSKSDSSLLSRSWCNDSRLVLKTAISYVLFALGGHCPLNHSQLLSRSLRFELKTSILCETYIFTFRFCRVFLLPFIDFYCILQDSNPKHLHYERLKINSDTKWTLFVKRGWVNEDVY